MRGKEVNDAQTSLLVADELLNVAQSLVWQKSWFTFVDSDSKQLLDINARERSPKEKWRELVGQP